MRQTCIFSGSSHPYLVEAICERLGQKPSRVELKKFSNGETSVEIKASVRDQDVFVVQSGSGEINDNVMEMLIMISACKGGSSRSITAVMPYFPYSRQSKKKAHRGAITARMLANLMKVAGVDHVITIDLHATQMQGFFKCPVDNLFAEPLLSKWIRMNIPDWRDSVVVSKNPGGTKRVTSLADKLGTSFGIVGTERKRPKYSPSMLNSVVFESLGDDGTELRADGRGVPADGAEERITSPERDSHAPKPLHPSQHRRHSPRSSIEHRRPPPAARPSALPRAATAIAPATRARGLTNGETPHPLAQSIRPDSSGGDGDSREKGEDAPEMGLSRVRTLPTLQNQQSIDDDGYEEPESEEGSDERARDVITGRLVHGHIVDDDVPSPNASHYSENRGHRQSSEDEDVPDHMTQSFMSTTSSRWNTGNNPAHGLGGTGDATHSDEEEEEALQNPDIETHVTLVGNVRNKSVIIVDDMIDKAGSWIAAAETVVKRGGATKVYCMATHGLFGGDCLRQLDECDEIDGVIVTNAFPIPEAKRHGARKLTVLDVSGLLAEAIRRNHHGESISQLYHLMD
ncbi:hypothetical protein DOTSEDRAFT_69311 [Dothistroma septosporum NZE10]|uniref:Ribose-phosphate pyrophosphokinase 1 n=1 Tax=Dothistroma septosporum (strain NZE10 / CBS 128990) TaxID=675120 RepID=N1PYM5_DOTSN|nr:hypothetical protein DOTSEDRAFT_69311 [Dothistroma septosporum NZE10]